MNASRLLTAVVAGALVVATTGSVARPGNADGVYRVRPDPRLCPSPVCGGFFVRLVNRPTTSCGDGAARAWCYVARIDLTGLPAAAQTRVQGVERAGNLLLRGRIAPDDRAEFHGLSRLVAGEAWLAATSTTSSGIVFLVTDTGIRCIRAPCFALRAGIVNTSRAVKASGLDLKPVAAGPSAVRLGRAALATGGLLVAGTSGQDTDGGRTVVASQFYLRAS